MAAPYIGDLDFSGLFFTPMQQKSGKKSVDLYRSAAPVAPSNRVKFQLCRDETEPTIAKWNLDGVRDDSDPTRRKFEVRVTDPAAIAALKAFDEAVVQHAQQHSKEWFKKELTLPEVKARYKELLIHDVDDDTYSIKFKVKCLGAAVPTKILRLVGDGEYVESDEADLTRHSEVVPILQTFGVWFLGDAQFGVSFFADKLLVRPHQVADAIEDFALSRPFKRQKPQPQAEEEAPVSSTEAGAVAVKLVDDDDDGETAM